MERTELLVGHGIASSQSVRSILSRPLSKTKLAAGAKVPLRPTAIPAAATMVCNVARFNGRFLVAIAESHTYRGTAMEMDCHRG